MYAVAYLTSLTWLWHLDFKREKGEMILILNCATPYL